MNRTYRAVEVTHPGVLNLVQRTIPEPAPGQACRRGDFVNCTNQPVSGVHYDGGYAEVMVAIPSGFVAIPGGLSSVEPAPLLCAGLTTYYALECRKTE